MRLLSELGNDDREIQYTGSVPLPPPVPQRKSNTSDSSFEYNYIKVKQVERKFNDLELLYWITVYWDKDQFLLAWKEMDTDLREQVVGLAAKNIKVDQVQCEDLERIIAFSRLISEMV
jgi:hypothetical protein